LLGVGVKSPDLHRKRPFKVLQAFIKTQLIKMADAADNSSAVDLYVNTPIDKSPELLASETLDSPAEQPAPYRLFNRQKTVHEVFGGGMGE
jgi:hypothetical protein